MPVWTMLYLSACVDHEVPPDLPDDTDTDTDTATDTDTDTGSPTDTSTQGEPPDCMPAADPTGPPTGDPTETGTPFDPRAVAHWFATCDHVPFGVDPNIGGAVDRAELSFGDEELELAFGTFGGFTLEDGFVDDDQIYGAVYDGFFMSFSGDDCSRRVDLVVIDDGDIRDRVAPFDYPLDERVCAADWVGELHNVSVAVTTERGCYVLPPDATGTLTFDSVDLSAVPRLAGRLDTEMIGPDGTRVPVHFSFSFQNGNSTMELDVVGEGFCQPE